MHRMINTRAAMSLVMWSLLASGAMNSPAAVPEAIPLWPQGAPGSEARMREPEKVDEGPGKCNVSNVHIRRSRRTCRTGPMSRRERRSSLPLAVDIACCVWGTKGTRLPSGLLNKASRRSCCRYRLAREEGSTYTVDDHAMADTRRAIRLVRSRADEWGIKPNRIGILGFSAGGELAALAAMDFDNGNTDAADPIEQAGCRPDFQVLIYPGSSNRFTVKHGMPPAFIALGQNDREDISLGMAQLYLKYKAAKVPCELHIYSERRTRFRLSTRHHDRRRRLASAVAGVAGG